MFAVCPSTRFAVCPSTRLLSRVEVIWISHRRLGISRCFDFWRMRFQSCIYTFEKENTKAETGHSNSRFHSQFAQSIYDKCWNTKKVLPLLYKSLMLRIHLHNVNFITIVTHTQYSDHCRSCRWTTASTGRSCRRRSERACRYCTATCSRMLGLYVPLKRFVFNSTPGIPHVPFCDQFLMYPFR